MLNLCPVYRTQIVMILFTEIKKRPDVPPPFRNFAYGLLMIILANVSIALRAIKLTCKVISLLIT